MPIPSLVVPVKVFDQRPVDAGDIAAHDHVHGFHPVPGMMAKPRRVVFKSVCGPALWFTQLV
jgi:hypothetical protein